MRLSREALVSGSPSYRRWSAFACRRRFCWPLAQVVRGATAHAGLQGHPKTASPRVSWVVAPSLTRVQRGRCMHPPTPGCTRASQRGLARRRKVGGRASCHRLGQVACGPRASRSSRANASAGRKPALVMQCSATLANQRVSSFGGRCGTTSSRIRPSP